MHDSYLRYFHVRMRLLGELSWLSWPTSSVTSPAEGPAAAAAATQPPTTPEPATQPPTTPVPTTQPSTKPAEGPAAAAATQHCQ